MRLRPDNSMPKDGQAAISASTNNCLSVEVLPVPWTLDVDDIPIDLGLCVRFFLTCGAASLSDPLP